LFSPLLVASAFGRTCGSRWDAAMNSGVAGTSRSDLLFSLGCTPVYTTAHDELVLLFDFVWIGFNVC
jgi:hypothetical protein